MWVAALWLLLRFTAPGDTIRPGVVAPCKSYIVQGKDTYGYIWSPTLYDVKREHTPIPKKPGERDSVYVLVSEDGRVRLYRIAGKDSAGNQAPFSNIISAQAYGKQIWWRPQPRSVWP